jgi:hypothetical protein
MAAKTSTPAAAASPRATESEELQRLQRGELSLNEYLDAQVEQGVRHVQGLVTAEQLEIIKEVLREELATAPDLIELVRLATGQEPRLPGDVSTDVSG